MDGVSFKEETHLVLSLMHVGEGDESSENDTFLSSAVKEEGDGTTIDMYLGMVGLSRSNQTIEAAEEAARLGFIDMPSYPRTRLPGPIPVGGVGVIHWQPCT